MTTDELRDLIQLVLQTGIAEIEVQRGENRVRIRRSFGAEGGVVTQSAAAAPVAASTSSAVPATGAPAQTGDAPTLSAATVAAASEAAAPSGLTYVKSPIVGTFYEAASPESPPFVRV